MAPIKLIVWNVRGMLTRPKHLVLLSHLKAMRADMVVLLETHLTVQLQLTLKRTWIGWVYQASYTPYSSGVAILISKHVQFQLLTLRTDPQGRYIFLDAMISGFEFLIITYYAPHFNLQCCTMGSRSWHNIQRSQPWLGDFNMVVDPALDKLAQGPSSTLPPTVMRFGHMMREFALVDTWRHKYPSSHSYSCYSSSHSTVSHIDYIFVSPSLLMKIVDVECGIWHSGVVGPFLILADNRFTDCTLFLTWTRWRVGGHFFFSTNGGTDTLGVVWESFMLHAKMILSTSISRYK